jgi:hypothetical protein
MLSFTLSLYHLCCIGEARSAREAGISFIFPWFVVRWHSDLKVPCSNLTRHTIYFQETLTVEAFLFRKAYQLTYTKYELVS